VDENTGCSSLAMDPKSAQALRGRHGQIDIKTGTRERWARQRTHVKRRRRHVAATARAWTSSREVGKVIVTIAPSNPKRVYALIETGDGVPWQSKQGKETDRGQVWRSDDGGETGRS
jgi:hypothetical protein